MPFQTHTKGITVFARLTPGARKTGITSVMDAGNGKTALKISIHAPPEDGKANKELTRLLADVFGVPKSHVSLLSGETQRLKIILIEGDGKKLMEKAKKILAP